MLIEKAEEICEALGLIYKGGDDFWQNLGDYPEDSEKPFEQRNKYVFFRPGLEKGNVNGFGAIESFDIDSQLVLAVRSKLSDPTYEYKYETHIKPLKRIAKAFIEEFGLCDGYTLKSFSMIPVTDVYDTNMDGWMIKFVMQEEDE